MSDSESEGSAAQVCEPPPLAVPPPLPRAPLSLGPLLETRRPEVFLLPQSRQTVVAFSRAYVCESCRAVRGPEDLSVEIESYFCPACLDAMPQIEALACSCRCTKCFDCPRCFATLGVVREPRSGVDTPETLVAGAAPSLGPERCDSLLSLSSDEETEGGSAAATSASSAAQFDFFFACPACKWSSKPLEMKSQVSGLLPAAGTAEERGGRVRRSFSPLFEALQAAAQERERTRQLEARVKHKAVALLFAAAAATGNFTGRGPLGRMQRDKTWRVVDVEQRLRERAAEAAASDVWARLPQDVPHAAQRVSLAELLAGKHLAPREVISEFDWNRRLQQDMFSEDADDEDFTAEETKALEPLNANQVLVDRRGPDCAPVEVLGLLGASGGQTREPAEGGGGGEIDENVAQEVASVEQRLRKPNATVVAETSGSLLHPVRKRLLTRQSRRCRTCQKFVVKSQVSPNAVPPLRLNSAAALLLPRMHANLRSGAVAFDGIVDVELGVLNPTEVPMFLTFHLAHGAEEDEDMPGKRRDGEATKDGRDAAEGDERKENADKKGADAEGAGQNGMDKNGAEEPQRETARRNWQTLDILTKNFQVALDPYDEMLEELNTDVGELRADDDPTIVLARKGNAVLLRLRVRAKKWALHQVAASCMTVDVSVEDSSPIRACYVLSLGRIAYTSEAELQRRESL
ncbi:dynactin subunit 4 [Toxoplasma gondii MAS]|uniref:Dynactin subunit 4 n=1 Tax=Toxoplasma gondii MAS TaxID=943118 RepID=A0A086R027_TOXGO|nr:dynactin subunit 4 [Toxoplasma gondii MAS]